MNISNPQSKNRGKIVSRLNRKRYYKLSMNQLLPKTKVKTVRFESTTCLSTCARICAGRTFGAGLTFVTEQQNDQPFWKSTTLYDCTIPFALDLPAGQFIQAVAAPD
jgi:hypothetical protein